MSSGGRVGLGIASGWVPNDFVISGHQDDFENRKQVFRDKTEILRRLWRGEPHKVRNPLGEEVDLIMPRPVQPDLPIWITAAANPATFREAGTIGAHVLTHLLGQTVEDLATKIVQYREAWDAAGHVGRGTVTLMLHTLVGDDDDEVHDLRPRADDDLSRRLLRPCLPAPRLGPFLKVGRIDVSQLTPELAEAALGGLVRRNTSTWAACLARMTNASRRWTSWRNWMSMRWLVWSISALNRRSC